MQIEDNKDKESLLAKYGRAVSLCNTAETFVTEVIKQKSGLSDANKIVVDSLLNTTFGPKISLLEKVVEDKELITKLKNLNSDRILLAHGLSVESADGKSFLIHKAKLYDLSEIELGVIIEKARDICHLLTNLMDKHHIKL